MATQIPDYMQVPDYTLEEELIAAGLWPVAGVDEAGRGPLAGPVAAAAVILDPRDLPAGLDDSKKLTPAARDELFAVIMAKAHAVAVSFASPAEIDGINIRAATLLAMRRSLAALCVAPRQALIDGDAMPARLVCPARAIVGGDALCMSIAAASIVAKVMRDRLMTNLCRDFPQYGFSRHFGYATPAHREALEKHGPSPFHRHSFAPVRAALTRP